MRRLLLPLFLLALPIAGCDCFGIFGGIPFNTEHEGVVVFPLGAVGDCTAADNGTVPADGQPDADGNLTVYSHANDGTACSLKADWTGTLVNMEELRAEVDAELEEAGFEPGSVTLRVTSMTPTVETVVLRDDETEEPINLESGALLGYNGAISVEGDEDIIVASYDGNGDPTLPDVDVKDSAVLVELANTSFADGTALRASGAGNTEIEMSQLPDIQAAGQPALVVTFQIAIEGQASLGGGE